MRTRIVRKAEKEEGVRKEREVRVGEGRKEGGGGGRRGGRRGRRGGGRGRRRRGGGRGRGGERVGEEIEEKEE